MLVIGLAEITDRNAAECLRNKEVFVEKDEIRMEADSYLDVDIIGMDAVAADGTKIGEITNVLHNSAQDIYEITKPGGKAFLLPAVRAFVRDVDLQAHRMTVELIDGIDEI